MTAPAKKANIAPAGWEILPVAEIASFQSGESISVASLHEESTDTQVPVYGGNGVAGYTRLPNVSAPVIVIGRVGQRCGEVHLTRGPAWVTDNALFPRTFFKKVYLPFFSLALQAARLNNEKNRNDLPLLTQSILGSALISLPTTMAEQEAITEALDDADDLIGSLEHHLTKKRDVKQGAMQELLTGRKRLPGFSGEWEVKRLGALGHFFKGRGVTKEESLSGNLPCVRYGEIYTRHNDYVRAFYSRISSEVATTATLLKCGDILFAGSGETREEIGKSVAFKDEIEAYAGGDIVILRSQEADPIFLGYYFNTAPIAQQKASRGQGDAVVHISAAALADIQGTFPSVAEQNAIACVLTDMDDEIAALEAKLTKAHSIKDGMMQELLTGKTRLV